ncbi:MAG: glutamine--fructose-6-phosphate transaminase (isomerizing) [Oscillospiraceae bacterium]|nr:glutamine--fructose-6-phosphate transaminase (isomerizing) [Oscillospiraceae bacterium]
MCGIIGFTGTAEAAPVVLEGLKKLEYRGYDSAGVAVVGKNGLGMVKASGKIENLCKKVEECGGVSGTTGIGHTRWATHGAPTDTNAHPHMSEDGRFAIVHNGIIENFAELREELIAKGCHFKSETDTEVIVHLLSLYYKGDFKRALMKTVARLEGSYAIGAVCSECPESIFVTKIFNPMIIGVGAGENFFASDVTALVSHTKNVIYLEDGEIAELTPEEIKFFNAAGKPIEKKISRVAWDTEAAEKGGYEHFMLKEIMEQPHALKSAIEPRIKNKKAVLSELNLSEEQLKGINHIIITACGSAYYAGCAGKYTIEKLTRIPVTVELASELRYSSPIVDEHTLLIVLSQSGETLDTICAMRELKDRGVHTVAIVNVVGSTIAKLADSVIYTYAGPEIAVATTKGYTTQVAVLYLFAVYAAEKTGRITSEEAEKLTAEILSIPSDIQRAIDLNSHIAELAEKYHNNSSLFFIGRNVDYAVALEGSLKMKEISYLHSEAYAAGELKHGTIALISEGRLVIAIACYEELFDKMMSNIKEVKARGAEVLGVAAEDMKKIFSEADDVILVPKTHPLFSVPSEIVPLQILAYYVAKANGCDIDKPRNLAKSVTVE